MTRLETIIAVENVSKSSAWYQQVLGLKSNHGGDTFEMLADKNDCVILCLHKWGEHEHPTLTDPTITKGNGLILYFRVTNFLDIWNKVVRLNLTVEQEPHFNENSGQQQFILRDLDGYYLIISE
jgi:hypothetical protein